MIPVSANPIRYAGLVLMVVGLLVAASGSGAFTTTVADRTAGIGVADDANAYVGLEYPAANATGVVNLNSSNADRKTCSLPGFGWCWLGEYEYNNVPLVRVTDGIQGEQLVIRSLTHSGAGNGVTNDTEDVATGNGLRLVRGDFRCQSLLEQQQSATTTVTVTVDASAGALSVQLDREITVRCLAG